MSQGNTEDLAADLTLEERQKNYIETLIKARYPIIWIVTHEEGRATAMLEIISSPQATKKDETKCRNVIAWDNVRGLQDISPWKDEKDRENPKFANTAHPTAAIEQIDAFLEEEKNLVVLYDIHKFFDDNPTVVRGLKNVARGLGETYTNIIIVSPQLNIPIELEKLITVVDLELPSFERLAAEYDHFISLIGSGFRNEVDINVTAEEKKSIISAAQGLTTEEFGEALAKSLVTHKGINKNVILDEKKQAVRKSGALEFYETMEDISSVGGMENIKRYIGQRTTCFSDSAIEYGLPLPKGILLLGVQGCGKSLMCKAISSQWGLPLLRLDVGAIFGGYVGESESNMRAAIKLAEAVSPCILWVDEIEKGLSGSQSSNFSDGGTTSRVFGSFVTWMQEKTKPVYLIATANDVSQLPPELLRKGRFDEIFFVDLPSETEKEEIFSIHLGKKASKINEINVANFDISQLAAKCSGFSGAEIEQVIIDALYNSYSDGQRALVQEDILNSIKVTKPLSVTMKENIDAARAWAKNRARRASGESADVDIPDLDDMEGLEELSLE